jgi:hypothetical protein
MKNIRAAVALFLVSVFLAAGASANTSSINPNVPAQNSPLSSSVLRGNFSNAYTDENTIYGIFALSSNQLLGTINAGNAGPLNLPTCSTGALSWTPGTGFGCNSLSGLVSPITQSLVFTGQIGISLNATALPTKQTGSVLQLGNADGVASRIENDAFASTAFFTGVRSDGTNAAPTTLQNLDEISGINAWGYNGSSVVGPRASVREFAAQNWTGSAQGTRVDIATTLNNTTSMSPVCGFENDGGVTCPPTVTGGDQGAGKINAAGLFVNGVAVSTGNSAISALTAALASNSIENNAFSQVWNYDTLSTQTALQITGTGVTTGELFNSSVVNSGSTGYAGYFSNTGTAIAYGVYATEGGASNTGYAGYFNNASATGYAVYATGQIAAPLHGLTSTTTGAPPAGFTGFHQRLANSLFIATNGADALTVTSTGGVGIGTTSPSTALHVVTTGTGAIEIDSTQAVLTLNSLGSGGDNIQFQGGTTANSAAHTMSVFDATSSKGPFTINGSNGLISLMSVGVYAFSTNSSFASGTTNDTGISRDSAGVIDVGNGGAADKSGSVKLTNLTASGIITLSSLTTPADNAVCTAGTIWVDTGFIYVCQLRAQLSVPH